MAVHPVETEIKLAASPDVLAGLREHPLLAGTDHTATLVTTYFDTIDSKLRRCGATLRLRDDGQSREQTLKLASHGGSAVRRKEWNVAATGDVPQPGEFPVPARTALDRLLGGARIEPLATTRVERTTRSLHVGNSVVEIAFDLGTIRAGDREEGICELEFELVSGTLADLMALVLQLPLGPDLSWSVNSKAERCHLLAHDVQPAPVRAQPVKLSQSINVVNGFRAIAWNCLDQLLANYPLVVASGNSEALHQSRVAIRRLRSAFTLFRDVLDDEAAPLLQAGLKAVATGLGPARNIHVLRRQVASAARHMDHEELCAHLGARQDAATQAAQALLASRQFQKLLFELACWIEDGDWQFRKRGDGVRPKLSTFAGQVLTRRRRKLRRLPDSISDMAEPARHQLRIKVKKLAYFTEFVASLYRDKAAARQRTAFGAALKRLQDALGELNDAAIASTAHTELFGELDPITAATLAAQLDELVAGRVKSPHELVKAAEHSLAHVAEAKAWWKAGP